MKRRPQRFQSPTSPVNPRSLHVELLEARLVPGEAFSSLWLMPMGCGSVADAASTPSAPPAAPAVASSAQTADCANSGPFLVEQTASTDASSTSPSSSSTAEGTVCTETTAVAASAGGDTAPAASAPAGDLTWLDSGFAVSPSSQSYTAGGAATGVGAAAGGTSVVAPATAPTVAPMAPAAATSAKAAQSESAAVFQAASAPQTATPDAGSGVAVPMLSILPTIKPFGGPGVAGYSPAQIRHAYGFDNISTTLNGSGETIAIVDAYDAPNIQGDLGVFSTQFGLPTPGSGNFTFTKVYAQGAKPPADAGWAGEISLDVEWAHAIAPDANIMLVEAASATTGALFGAVDYATSHHIVNGQIVAGKSPVVSMSWGSQSAASDAANDIHFIVPGVTFLASAGDTGGQVSYPSASPYVVSVGGTNLPLDSKGNRTGPETGWTGSGGGPSASAAEPGYQVNYGITITGGKKGTPDVAYDADPNTGVAVYDSYLNPGQKGWMVVGGTSMGAPQWAGLIALVDQGHAALSSDNLISSPEYTAATGPNYAKNYYDVTSGSAGGNTAGPGYDLVTGVGTPHADQLVTWLIKH